MRVSLLQENLARGLAIASRAISTRPTLPILSNVLLTAADGRLTLAATNLELSVVARVGAKVDEDGAITIPCRLFQDFVNMLPPERVDLVLDTKTNKLNVRCGDGVSININGLTADDYPQVPAANGDEGIAVPAQAFNEMIGHVVFAAAREDNRPVLTGIMMRFDGATLTMAASDGYRLMLRTIELDEAVSSVQTLVVPARTLSELSRMIGSEETTVRIILRPENSQIMFHVDKLDLTTQLIEGTYPSVEQIIPKNHTTLTMINTQDLLRACKRAEVFARDEQYTMRLKVTPGESTLASGVLMLNSQSKEVGDSENKLEVKVSGQPVEIAFNVHFLIEALNVIKEEQVVLETTDSAKPGVLRPLERQDFTHVIMPMQLR